MTQLEIIKQRLTRYTDPGTDTDEKLEEGSIMDWVNHSDTDMAWLVGRLETTEARVAALEGALRQIQKWTRLYLPLADSSSWEETLREVARYANDALQISDQTGEKL